MQKESEKDQHTAMAEAKAARQEAKKMRSMKQESLASATSMPASLSSLGSARDYFMARAASGIGTTPHQEPGGVPPTGQVQPTPEGSRSRSQLSTPEINSDDRATTPLVSALSSASSRGAGRAGKSQRFAPDVIAGLASVPETLPGAAFPDDSSPPVHVPPVQGTNGGVPAPSTQDAAGTMDAVGGPAGSAGMSVQDSQTHLEDMIMSPFGSTASLQATPPSTADPSSVPTPTAATCEAVSAHEGTESRDGMSSRAGTAVGAADADAGFTIQGSSDAAPSRGVGLFGKFKAKAAEIVQEQRLGSVKRFASKALVDTMAKVEQCATLMCQWRRTKRSTRSYSHCGAGLSS